jgi:allantoate deiminase
LFTIADVPKPDSQTVIARCRELAAISEMTGGTLRTFLSPVMRRCYDIVGEWMKSAGMTVSVDAAGNLRGTLAGTDPGKRVFVMGSHLDTVRAAGAFDGVLGVLMAIAIAGNYPPNRLPFDLEVIGFSEEEGVRFGIPFIGSKAVAGLLDEATLHRTDTAGVSIAQAIRDFGLDPNRLPDAAFCTPPIGFLEFHIEQGPILDNAGESVGIVEAIAGQSRASAKFIGSANHAGTTPMPLRRDSLAATAQWIAAVEQIAQTTTGLVATNGKIEVQPNVSNVIPGEATLSLDVRHDKDEVRNRACEDMRRAAAEIARSRGLAMAWTDLLSQPAVRLHASLTNILAAVAPSDTRRMVSGAGHDAMILAPHIPTAMLFLRSPGGISHHPAESVLPEDVDLALEIGCRFIESIGIEYK